jgi:hypothetical protein
MTTYNLYAGCYSVEDIISSINLKFKFIIYRYKFFNLNGQVPKIKADLCKLAINETW